MLSLLLAVDDAPPVGCRISPFDKLLRVAFHPTLKTRLLDVAARQAAGVESLSAYT